MQSPLRVAHVLPALQVGGAERLAVNLCVYHTPQCAPACIIYDAPAHTHYEQLLHQHGIPLYSLFKGRAYDVRVFARLHRLLRQQHPHVLHLHISGINYALPMLMLLRTPAVYTIHNLARYDLHARRGGRFIQYLAFRHRLGGIQPVAISQLVARSFAQLYGGDEPPVIWNGIPVAEFEPCASRRAYWRQQMGFSEQAVLITSVAGFRPQKNLALLIRAFAPLTALHTEAHLLLVGSGEQEPMLRTLVSEHRVEARVHFLGIRHDVMEILNASDIFALSSDWEGTPMAVMEAMASRLPIVSTAVGGVPELVEHGIAGILVPQGDVVALREALATLITQPELRHQMGEAARQFAHKQFDIRHTVEAYEQLYLQLAARR